MIIVNSLQYNNKDNYSSKKHKIQMLAT